MPKEITHIFFAEQTNDNLKNIGKDKLYSFISDNKTFFHFGSIAVDTFYYSVKLPFIDKDYFQWGDLVHGSEGNDTSLPLIKMLQFLKSNPDTQNFQQKLAFVCGFLTHMAMDINFHPYVYYFSGNYYDEDKDASIDAQMRHRIIEGWIDLYMLNKDNRLLEDFYELQKIENEKDINLQLLRFLGDNFSEIFDTDKEHMFKFLKKGYNVQILLNKLFRNISFKDFIRTLNSIFDNKLRGLLALFYPGNYERFPDYIINFGTYKNPVTGEDFNGTVDDIWADALRLSTDFLGAVNDYIFGELPLEELKNIIKGYSLDVGLLGVKVEEVKFFSPWQLIP